MENPELDLNDQIVEKQPLEAGAVSLLFYRIKNIDFGELEEIIEANRLKESEIREKTTSDGFTDELVRRGRTLRVGFARGGIRKISFMIGKEVVPFRLLTIPQHINLQFEKIGGATLELILQDGRKSFLNRHFLKTLRTIAKTHGAKLNKLTISQRFIKAGLQLHKEEVYFVKFPPAQLEHVTSMLHKTQNVQVERARGEVKGSSLLRNTNLLSLLNQNPEIKVEEYRARMGSPVNGEKIKYSIKASGEMQFFLGYEEVQRIGSQFDAALKLMNTLRSKIRIKEGKEQWPESYLPDIELSLSLLRSKIEEGYLEEIDEMLLDLETLDLFRQLKKSDKREIFSLFLQVLRDHTIKALQLYGDSFLSLLSKGEVKDVCSKRKEHIQAIDSQKFGELLQRGFLLFPCLKPLLLERKEEISRVPHLKEKLKGFTLSQLEVISKEILSEAKTVMEKKKTLQKTLNQSLEKAIDLRNTYISQERKLQELRAFAISFFSAFIDATVSKKEGHTTLLLQKEGSSKEYLVRLKAYDAEILPEDVTRFGEELEKLRMRRGIFFTLSKYSKLAEEERREILRKQGILILMVDEETIEKVIRNAVFSLTSLRIFEKETKYWPTFS
ncbi:MAG: hypothetical protein GWO20_01180 [Candidatus Korarchaeota archaeon]|nr:hypothetical protein [Candidatus Korarchaeota archaeon]NIU83057.1 hypothetical protein [Candidatus Thorarchaeota archaeon]NIW12601.1 hypothetical protein [Candidatus Thorarchaeota archaeon]NIW50812.1 hypothetical protein [Candidatus Korarchaeota archaeon]